MNPKNRTLVIVVAAIVVVLGLAGIAVLVSGGDDTSTSDDRVPTYSDEAVQFGTVDVSGDVLPQYMDTDPDPAVGTAAPVVIGEDFDGNPITLGGEQSNATMLVFLAHWCPHCNNEVPRILEIDDDGGIPADLDVIGISTGASEGAPNWPPSEWVVDKGWRWPTMADDEQQNAMVAFGGSSYPTMMIIDADGNLVARTSGEMPTDELTAWISAAMASIDTSARPNPTAPPPNHPPTHPDPTPKNVWSVAVDDVKPAHFGLLGRRHRCGGLGRTMSVPEGGEGGVVGDGAVVAEDDVAVEAA
ncbi:MAG: TlpA disulfide reductase family protein [Ilumatobacteraceae bacterium]